MITPPFFAFFFSFPILYRHQSLDILIASEYFYRSSRIHQFSFIQFIVFNNGEKMARGVTNPVLAPKAPFLRALGEHETINNYNRSCACCWLTINSVNTTIDFINDRVPCENC
jgi:hypothetical protein